MTTLDKTALANDLRSGARKVAALRNVAGLRDASLTTLNRLKETAERAADYLDALSSIPAQPVADVLRRIVKCDDDAKAARGKPGASLNGLGLVDMFDIVGHPFGVGEHKQTACRSVELEVAIEDARSALTSHPSAVAVTDEMVERASRVIADVALDAEFEGDAASEWHRIAPLVRAALEAALVDRDRVKL